jgi:hypothetical protein
MSREILKKFIIFFRSKPPKQRVELTSSYTDQVVALAPPSQLPLSTAAGPPPFPSGISPEVEGIGDPLFLISFSLVDRVLG